MSSGTYIVKAGAKFYIGSTSRLSSRKSDHITRLQKGSHPNKRLQDAFNNHGDASFISIEFIHRQDDEDKREFWDRLKSAEQKLLNEHSTNPHLCNESSNARGPCTKCAAKRAPMTEETRAKIRAAAKDRIVSEETRSKMAKAKTGAENPKARGIRIKCPDGSIKEFPTVTDMAKFFRVTQQTADHWVRGVCAWPGTSIRNRSANAWIADYSIVR